MTGVVGSMLQTISAAYKARIMLREVFSGTQVAYLNEIVQSGDGKVRLS